jgi:hypothetical protein
MQQHVFSTITRYSRGVQRAVLALLLTLGAAACTPDALLSPEGARPHATGAPLVSVTPGSALVGDTGVVLTIRGSGFTDWSLVQIDPWLPASVTFVDDSTLTARIEAPLWEANTHQVSVSTDLETSDPLPFVVENPIPVITRISPEWCEVGGDCQTVTLHGRNFLPGVGVKWNGWDKNFTLLNDSTIQVHLSTYDTYFSELVQVTAVNAGPGGGSSDPALFQVGMRVVMHTAGATAGSNSFELEIHGESFSSGAVVYWNGSPRQTWVSNARRVSAIITAADVAAPGEGVVTMSTPGLMGGQAWRVGTITVRPQPSATVTAQSTLQLPVRDLAYSAFTGRLYGTLYDGSLAGYVAVIDPASGTMVDYVWVGAGARTLAVSDDGKYLWVGVDDEHRVSRVNLEYGYSDLQAVLDSGVVAEDLAVVPGKPHRVVVSRMTSGSPRHAGVAVYDGYSGMALPSSTPAGTGSNVITFGAKGSTLYGLDNETSNHRYRTMQVDDDGVTLVSTMWSGLSAPAGIVFAGGRLYNSGGPMLDTGYNDYAGGFYTLSGAVQPDLATGRAFFLGADAIRVGDINTFALLGTLSVPPLQFDDPAPHHRHLVRWGADGLAWHDADEVFLLRSPLVGQ